MSDSYIYSDIESFVTDNTARKKTADSKLLIIKVLVGILCVILAVEIVVYTVIIPTLVPVKISFSGLQLYTPEEMYRILDVSSDETWFQFDTSEAARRLAACSWIEDVTVEKHFPDVIRISVTERVPVAVTFINDSGRTIPVQIDKNGVLFSAKEGQSLSQLPLISGLPIEHFVEGMRLHSKYRRLMEQLAEIQLLPQKYLAAVSEIHVEPKDYGSYDLVLYPIHSKIKVYTDRTLNEDALQYMIVVLDVVESIASDIAEIDLRYGSVSFRTTSGSTL